MRPDRTGTTRSARRSSHPAKRAPQATGHRRGAALRAWSRILRRCSGPASPATRPRNLSRLAGDRAPQGAQGGRIKGERIGWKKLHPGRLGRHQDLEPCARTLREVLKGRSNPLTFRPRLCRLESNRHSPKRLMTELPRGLNSIMHQIQTCTIARLPFCSGSNRYTPQMFRGQRVRALQEPGGTSTDAMRADKYRREQLTETSGCDARFLYRIASGICLV